MKAWLWTRRGLVLAAGAVATAGAMAAGSDAPVPIEAFFRKPAISDVSLSPSGRHLALVATNKEGRNQMVILETDTLKPFVAAASKTLDVARIYWVNDKRLLYSLADPDRKFSVFTRPAGLFAVDRDGGEPRRMGGGLAGFTWLKDSDTIIVQSAERDQGELRQVYVATYDTRTGVLTKLPKHPRAWHWGFDQKNEPRFMSTVEKEGKGAAYVRDPASDEWKQVEAFDLYTGFGGFRVVGFADENTAYVIRRAKGSDFEALYTLDLRTRTFSAEPIVDAKGFDLAARIIRSGSRVLGLRYETDAENTIWVDEAMKKVQADLDKLLPSTINSISVPLRGEVPVVLVRAYADRQPSHYYLYDTRAGKLQDIGQSRPDIDPARMATREFVRIKTRDGLEMPVWVTRPRDGAKGPRGTVVLVHGGPYMRGGDWSWDAETQFLASRGYVVVEPEFRGSTGFGFRHFRAGWKQWGLAMQDDVADATRWAIAQGLADPKRVCIAGASYGGYATLMGLAKDPDLYKCGVDWVGVTDIDLLYSIHWSDSSELYKLYGMPVLVADREKDAGQIRSTSPIQLAPRIRQPLLLAYGGRDVRVPIKHGTEFRDAVTQTNPAVEWIVYDDEGHGWSQPANNVDFWTRVEKFLAKNIGP